MKPQLPHHARLLVVGGTSATVEQLTTLLQELNADVRVVSDGAVVSESESHPYDLVMVGAPDMNSLAQRIRATRACRSETPVLGFSGPDEEGYDQDCFAAGLQGCVSLPVTVEALAATIDLWTAPEGADRDYPLADADPSRELLRQFEEIYRRTTPAVLADALHAFGDQRFDDLAKHVHKLRSSALSLGYRRVGELCLLLETQIRAHHRSSVAPLWTFLHSAANRNLLE